MDALDSSPSQHVMECLATEEQWIEKHMYNVAKLINIKNDLKKCIPQSLAKIDLIAVT